MTDDRIERRAGYTVRVRGTAPAVPSSTSVFSGAGGPAVHVPVTDADLCAAIAGPFREWREKTGRRATFRRGNAQHHPSIGTYEPPVSLVRDAERVARGERLR